MKQEHNLVKSEFPSTGQVATGLGSAEAVLPGQTEADGQTDCPLQDEAGCVAQGIGVWLFLDITVLICYGVSILGLRSASEYFQIPVPSEGESTNSPGSSWSWMG